MKASESRSVQIQTVLFFSLVIVVVILSILNVTNAFLLNVPEEPEPEVTGTYIRLGELTLREKIAQMIIGNCKDESVEPYRKMRLGGVFFWAMDSPEAFSGQVERFQEGRSIPMFVSADLEGCLNPFENFRNFSSVADLETSGDALLFGQEHGRTLRSLGFNLNFAPVVDLNDTIWKCRSFQGSTDEVAEKAAAYVRGLQGEGILATLKHYPGKTLIGRDPHKYVIETVIEEKDLYPYEYCFHEEEPGAVMVSHHIAAGAVSSDHKPSVVSESPVGGLRSEYDGLIVTDEISMLGVRDFYQDDDAMFIELFRADNDVILFINSEPSEIKHMIDVVEEAVHEGVIPEERIDRSVRRILRAKGLRVVG